MSQNPVVLKNVSVLTFGKLPPELQTIILQHAFTNDASEYLTYLSDGEPERAPLESKRERLKPIRLLGRVFHDAVTHAVFASIHIHASDLSLARAENIANSRLAGHVKEIVYHEGSFANRNRDQVLFFSTLASNRRRQDYPVHLKEADRDKLYVNFVQEVEAATAFPIGKGGGFLNYQTCELTKKLPHLLTFVVLPYHDEWHDPETSAYTLRRTGLSYLPQVNSHSSDIQENDEKFIRSMAGFQPRRLNMSLFPISNLCPIVRPPREWIQNRTKQSNSMVDPVFEWAEKNFLELRHLKIGPAYGAKYGYGVSLSDELHRDTTILLQAAVNLIHLELTNDYPLSRTFTVLPSGKLPRLETLVVSRGITLGHWPERALMQCITNVGGSLKHLHFDGIVLKDWSHGSENAAANIRQQAITDVPLGSLVRLLYQITSSTTLRSCTGLDSIEDLKSQGHRQSRYIRPGPKPGKEKLIKKLGQAVLHRLPWPIDVRQTESPHEMLSKLQLDDSKESALLAFISDEWAVTVDEFAVFEETSKSARCS